MNPRHAGYRRPLAPGPRVRRPGVSLIELMIVVTLVAVVTSIGSLYYRHLMDAAREERARTDCRTIIKAIQKLESDTKVTIRPPDPAPGPPQYNYPFTGMHPYLDPIGSGVNEPNGFTLEKLLDFRIMASLPDDPYGFQYGIDVVAGVVYSVGPDGMPDTGDELRVALRPPFEALKANFLEDRRTIEVHFSRKLDPFSLFFVPPDVNSPIYVSIPPLTITTVVRDISNPFAALVRLSGPVPLGTNATVVTQELAPDRQVRAMDASPLLQQVSLPVAQF